MADVLLSFGEAARSKKDQGGLQLVIQEPALDAAREDLAEVHGLVHEAREPCDCPACGPKIPQAQPRFQVNLRGVPHFPKPYQLGRFSPAGHSKR